MSRRALFLTPIFDPQVGGAAVHFEQLSRGLVENGAIDSFVIITSSVPDAHFYQRTAAGRIFRVLFSPKSIHKRWSKPKIALNYLIAAAITLLALVVYRVSIVHTHTKRYFSLPARIAKWSGRAVIVDGRDLGAPAFGATGDIFVCASRNIEERASRREEETTYIPIGIDPAELDVNCDGIQMPRVQYRLFVGDVASRKGVPELLTAHASISDSQQLTLIGELIDSNMNLDDRPNVNYLGTLSHQKALCYIRWADLVILPSKEEALGRVILEAIYHNTPVICPPNVPEYQKHMPELTLNEVTADEIEKKITHVLTSTDTSGQYPLERHYIANVLQEYRSLYISTVS